MDFGRRITDLIPVADAAQAAKVAAALADDGVLLIELCGGFDTAVVAEAVAAVDGRAAVGDVTYAVESLGTANRYAEAALAGED